MKIRYILALVSLLAPQVLWSNPANQEFHDAMRQLWNDHGIWTREYVVAAAADLASASVAVERLMRNQDDIGNAVGVYYGAAAGKALADLLKDHIKLAAAVVGAAKKGDDKDLKAQNDLWHKNAGDIAAFLSKANPHIKESDMKQMMYDHLSILTDVVTARLKKDWARDASRYDDYRGQLNHMADSLSKAITMHFPEKFGMPASKKS